MEAQEKACRAARRTQEEIGNRELADDYFYREIEAKRKQFIDFKKPYGDTLEYPRFREDNSLKQFDVVIANPPWNLDDYGEKRLKKAEFRERFSYGYTYQNYADWAWIQQMLASAKEKARVGVVINNGCLFRGHKEKEIPTVVVTGRVGEYCGAIH